MAVTKQNTTGTQTVGQRLDALIARAEEVEKVAVEYAKHVSSGALPAWHSVLTELKSEVQKIRTNLTPEIEQILTDVKDAYISVQDVAQGKTGGTTPVTPATPVTPVVGTDPVTPVTPE